MDSLREDVRYALRSLRRAPLFTFTAVMILALGIGVASDVKRNWFEHDMAPMALGARREDILALVLREGGQLVGLGLAVGAPLAAALCWVMTATLFGVVRPNAFTLLGICALLLTAAAALWVPAWRASRLDPVDALRRE